MAPTYFHLRTLPRLGWNKQYCSFPWAAALTISSLVRKLSWVLALARVKTDPSPTDRTYSGTVRTVIWRLTELLFKVCHVLSLGHRKWLITLFNAVWNVSTRRLVSFASISLLFRVWQLYWRDGVMFTSPETIKWRISNLGSIQSVRKFITWLSRTGE